MDISSIITAIDKELAGLQAARVSIAALASTGSATPVRRGPGRPPKSSPVAAKLPKPRKMTAEGRARIAAAQKKRWAASNKATKTAAKA
jgi:hypothetical protein